MPEDRACRIRALNDRFRQTLAGGHVVVTRGVDALGGDAVAAILAAVRCFDHFDAGNDPYGEHDFGSVTHDGRRLFWKIDCYDRTFTAASPDPADPAVTARVLTVMLADEY